LDPDRRDALAAFLLQHTYLVIVSTASLESAFRIFSVLNDRGLDLTVADILKSEIIGRIPPATQDALRQRNGKTPKWNSAPSASLIFSHISE
jgi:uncharacterized protein with ParB-like and HNH nuclease domain